MRRIHRQGCSGGELGVVCPHLLTVWELQCYNGHDRWNYCGIAWWLVIGYNKTMLFLLIIAPGFGSEGGAIQYMHPMSIIKAVRGKLIERIER